MTHIAAGLLYGLIYGIIVVFLVNQIKEPYRTIKFFLIIAIIAILGINYPKLTTLIFGISSTTIDLVALATLIFVLALSEFKKD